MSSFFSRKYNYVRFYYNNFRSTSAADVNIVRNINRTGLLITEFDPLVQHYSAYIIFLFTFYGNRPQRRNVCKFVFN